MPGNSDADGPPTSRMEDERQRARPPLANERLSLGVEMDEAVELRFSGHHEDQWHTNGTPLDLVDTLLRQLVVEARAEAVDGVCRKRHHPTASQHLCGVLQTGLRRLQDKGSPRAHAEGSEFVGMKDHASITRSRPPMSRSTRWPAKLRAADSVAAARIAGSSSARRRPPGWRRAGASSSRRATSAAPPLSE